jgi:hypothetical protein
MKRETLEKMGLADFLGCFRCFDRSLRVGVVSFHPHFCCSLAPDFMNFPGNQTNPTVTGWARID